MKNVFVLSLGFIVLLAACEVETESEVTVDTGASAEADTLITEAREVADFNRVRLETLGELSITRGDEASVGLEYSPKYEGVITTEVRGDTLIIGDNRNNMSQINRDVLRYSVAMSELEEVELGGSGDVTIGAFEAEDISLALGGSGDMTAEGLEVERLELALSGSGDVRVTGNADELTVGLAGSGDVNAQGLRAEQVEIGLVGSGDVNVCAARELDINIAGSGDVTYYGEPRGPDLSVLGSGEVDAGGECP